MGYDDLVSILIQSVTLNLLGKYVDLGGSELSSADAFFEEQIQFGKGTSSGLRDSEVCVDQAKEARSRLDKHLNQSSHSQIISRLTQKNPA